VVILGISQIPPTADSRVWKSKLIWMTFPWEKSTSGVPCSYSVTEKVVSLEFLSVCSGAQVLRDQCNLSSRGPSYTWPSYFWQILAPSTWYWF
jgi:hypothetical protein